MAKRDRVVTNDRQRTIEIERRLFLFVSHNHIKIYYSFSIINASSLVLVKQVKETTR